MRVAIVTGGARGLGLATCRALGAAGWHVLLTYHQDADAAGGAVASLTSEGISAESLRLDAGAPAAARELSGHPRLAAAARLVVVHNAAAAFRPTPLHLLDWDQFERQLG